MFQVELLKIEVLIQDYADFQVLKINTGLQATCLKAWVSAVVGDQEHQQLRSSCALPVLLTRGRFYFS